MPIIPAPSRAASCAARQSPPTIRVARASGATLALLASIALPFSSGCARHTSPGAEDREVVYRAESTIAVRIVNRSQVDAIVYVVHDGTRDRLGAVTAVSTANFTLRVRSLGGGGEFSLLADPIGSLRATSTETLRANQGSIFTWTLETDFNRGSVLVQE
ncbi:MAG: hypothetical protein ABJB78_09850 [Betaproteobacteria bacterium]